MFDQAKTGIQHNIPFTTNFKLFKFFSVSAGGRFQENWVGKTIKYNNFSEGLMSSKDTISGFDRYSIYNYNASITTKIYGIVNFKPNKKYSQSDIQLLQAYPILILLALRNIMNLYY